MIEILKGAVEYLQFFYQNRRTRWGLLVGCLPLVLTWIKFGLPLYNSDKKNFVLSICVLLLTCLVLGIYWSFTSGRIIFPKNAFNVVFCVKTKTPKSSRYIENTISQIKIELDKIGLLEKFRFIILGFDAIKDKRDAENFREKYDLDLIIWGELFSGCSSEIEACDFKKLFYTYKIPGNIVAGKLTDLYKKDINISIFKRDWYIYDNNSIPDTEKVSSNLTEIIQFIIGLIYLQNNEMFEDSISILENLYLKLEQKTKNELPLIDNKIMNISMSSDMLRKSRLLTILIEVYKNFGSFFIENHKFDKGCFYLEKYIQFKKPDVNVLSALAYGKFFLKDIESAKKFTDDIRKVDKNDPVYLLNKGFFGIYDKNYSSALYFYKEVSRNKNITDHTIGTKVIAFIDNMKRENSRESAYDFAIGVLNYFFCQQKIGRTELRQFIKSAKKKAVYAEMVTFAEELVGSKKKFRGKRK